MADPFPLELIELDTAVAHDLDRALRVMARELRALSDEEPGDAVASRRSDGGLWLAGGHSLLWTIYGVPAGRWGWASDGGA